MQNPTVAVINESTVVTDDQVKDVIAALQIQVDTDFAPIWHLDCTLVFQDKGKPAEPGVWQLIILDSSDQAGALGYHEMTATGDPLGKVFAGTDLRYGQQWSVTASHELLEMLADPWINLTAQAGTDLYAYEVCDACEADEFGYDIKIPSGASIKVSDFVTPEWFQYGASVNEPFDLKGHVTKILQILPDGYISVMHLGGTSTGWTQLNGRFTSPEREARSVPVEGHRRMRRAMSREDWRKSGS